MKHFILLTYLVSSAIGELCGPDKRCQCSPSLKEAKAIDCRSQHIKEFIDKEEITEQVESIYMNENDLTKLEQIPESQSLVYLNFANNSISTISFDAFDNLDELKTLVLSNNSLSVISDDIFEWNPLKLEVLYLDHNELEFIQHFVFYDLEKLTELYLHDNKLTFIHPHAFLQLTDLRRLTLNGNQLHTFLPKWINKLQPVIGYLRLDNNPWSCDCDMKEAIEWVRDTGELWFTKMTADFPMVCTRPLEHNRTALGELKSSIEKVKKYCNKPKIQQISQTAAIPYGKDVLLGCVTDKGDAYLPVAMVSWTAPNNDVYRLQNAYNYEGIEVHQNGSLKIISLDESDDGKYICQAKNSKGSFQAEVTISIEGGVPDVKPSVLPENKRPFAVENIAPLVENTDKFDTTCPENCRCISQHLDCAGDENSHPLTEIPSNIPESSLTVNLALNKIKIVGSKAFAKYTHLEEIRLDDNEIYDIKSDAFNGLVKLSTLTLRKNMLTRVEPNLFKDLSKLNVLVMDDNLIAHLMADMFLGLDKLNWLYIRNNRIEQIDQETFAKLPNIRFIHLEGNQLTKINVPMLKSTLTAAPGLQKIFLEDNIFDCNCEMEEMRKYVREGKTHEDLFADGIKCFKPDILTDKLLQNILEPLTCSTDNKITYKIIEKKNSVQLIGGIVLGVVLAFVIAIVWRKCGRRCRCQRVQTQRNELPPRSYRGTSGDYTPLMSAHVNNSEAFL